MLIAHRLASSNEPDIKKILDNTIILLVPSLNPDGVDIIKNWYDKTLGTPYEGTDPPELYHKDVGHDNNRDWYAFTQVETQLTVDKIHNVWHPQIVHDIHQQGENGSRLFLPPYMQPVEPNVPKQIVEGYTELGMLEHALRALQRRGSLVHGNGKACYLLGEALRELNRYEEALLPLERSADLLPDDIHVLVALGWCYKRTHRLAQAIDALERAVRSNPAEPLLHYNLACYRCQLGDRSGALARLVTAFRLEPQWKAAALADPDLTPLRDEIANLGSGGRP